MLHVSLKTFTLSFTLLYFLNFVITSNLGCVNKITSAMNHLWKPPSCRIVSCNNVKSKILIFNIYLFSFLHKNTTYLHFLFFPIFGRFVPFCTRFSLSHSGRIYYFNLYPSFFNKILSPWKHFLFPFSRFSLQISSLPLNQSIIFCQFFPHPL